MLNLVLYVTNLIVGIFFLNTAFSVLRRSFSVRRSRKRRALDLLLFSLSFMTGIVPIVSPGLLMNGYAFAAGTFIVIYDAANFVYALYRDGQARQRYIEP